MNANATSEKPRTRNASGQYAARGFITAKLLRKAYAPAAAAALPVRAFSSDPQRIVTFDATASVPELVDSVNGVIRGVSVITGGVIARGHDLEVDDTTLNQMKLCADTKGQVPVKVDHKSGAAAVCGFLTNFRIQENKLKADWHLLQSHPQKDQIIETAQRMPRGVGLSAAFVGPDKPERAKSGKNAARCQELISVDYVALPAANPNGMFSAKVDTLPPAMNPEILAAIKAAVAEAVAPIQQSIEAQGQQLEALSTPQPTLEDLASMSAEELAQFDLTPEDVQAALDEIANEQGEEQTEGDEQTDGQIEGQADGQAEGSEATASAAPAGATSAALSALTKKVTELSAKIDAAKTASERNVVETLFSEIEAKIEMLSAENESLTQALEAGGQPVTPGVDRNGVTFFSRNKNKGEFETLVQFGIEDKKLTKAKAFEFARAENPAAYDEYLVRLGVKQGSNE
jgi:polyhydroxyalkanoate synthesis regulator phasin